MSVSSSIHVVSKLEIPLVLFVVNELIEIGSTSVLDSNPAMNTPALPRKITFSYGATPDRTLSGDINVVLISTNACSGFHPACARGA